MSKKAKEAYLRKNGIKPRASHEGYSSGYGSTEDEGRSQPASPKNRAEGEKSWAQKRKENVLARATGSRSPREPEPLQVSLTAVQFAAKLKEGVKKSREEPSWKEKRMHAYLATNGAASRPTTAADVAFSSVLFAAKLRARVVGAALAPDATSEMAAALATAAAAKREARAASGELSWTEKRKQVFLAKYGRQRHESTPNTDVAISAVAFIGRLQQRVKLSAEANGKGEATAEKAEAAAPVAPA